MKRLLFAFISAFAFFACGDKEPAEQPPVFDDTPYELLTGNFPAPDLPADNRPTIEGVRLGRMLFYEKKLSGDNTLACADCHAQENGFSDIRRYSIGIDGLPGKRQAMAVMNLAWHTNGLFWDGRAPTLRDQALRPVQDPLEMHETLEQAEADLRNDKRYTDQFIRAFGDDQVSAARVGLALEQFMLTLISTDSKYDRWKNGLATLTDSEMRGRDLFFNEFDPFGSERGAECFHCHAGINFTNDKFMNNGLDPEAEQQDAGRRNVTNDPQDMARFKVPSLRNIALTAPYMHDGRFSTLEEVVEHYNTGVHPSPTLDGLLQYNVQPGGLKLTTQDRDDLVAFLKTLSDEHFITNPSFSSPF